MKKVRQRLILLMGDSYGEYKFEKKSNKLEKISRNNKSYSSKKSDTRRNTFALQETMNQYTDDIREDMAYMRT